MKKIILLFTLLVSAVSFSQIFKPVKWSTSVEKISDNEYYLVTKAKIDAGWNIYAQEVPKGGPRPTILSYKPNEDYELIGKTIEEVGITAYDKTFKMTIKKLIDSTFFRQKIKLLNNYSKIKGEVEFMVCNDERCLPPKSVDLVFEVPTAKKSNTTVATDTAKNNNVLNENESNLLLYGITKTDLQQPNLMVANNDFLRGENSDKPITTNSATSTSGKSIWTIFFIAFLSGFAALLTPCVFPMIPMTVSYFTKQSKDKKKGIKNAIIYGLSIIAIYVFLGYVVVTVFGADSLNRLSTNVWFNVIFFIILVVFAISFLGYFEITLPSSWATKIDNNADRSGFIGIFFMALALAIVSFSCTGPIVGVLLVEAVTKGGLAPIIGMFGFSLAIALPFTLFAAFPGWLQSLPKSGGWMNSVKVVLGFLELALAFKFLSKADLVAHWNLLKIEPFLIIWILIFAGLALYLFGKIKFPHDSPIRKFSFPRMALGVLVAAFTVYLATGFRTNEKTGTYQPLGGILSGLTPPVTYSIFKETKCPNNLNCFKSLKEGITYAKKVNKPILLDFTGYACENCRKMEEGVWAEKKIDDILRNDYVLISLYVDDKKELPKEQQIHVTDIDGTIRKLENYGHKWSHFQAVFFNTNSQPHYVLLSADGKQVLNNPIGYTPDAEKYLNWLKEGLIN